MRLHYDPKLKERAQALRKAGILSEVLLWNELKSRKLRGYQFSRQKPIDEYIGDFYCSKLSLVIEVDGSSHNLRSVNDSHRQARLESLGLTVLRFLDSDVRNNLAGVIALLLEWIDQRTSSTTPPWSPFAKGE
jgi:very-short-patch-repair endonuclease